jgi:hypothetical protein
MTLLLFASGGIFLSAEWCMRECQHGSGVSAVRGCPEPGRLPGAGAAGYLAAPVPRGQRDGRRVRYPKGMRYARLLLT